MKIKAINANVELFQYLSGLAVPLLPKPEFHVYEIMVEALICTHWRDVNTF